MNLFAAIRSLWSAASKESGLQALATYWGAVSYRLIAMARRLVLAGKMRDHSKAPFAQMLEAAIYTALIQISADIAAYSDADADAARSQRDKHALIYLKILHALLGVVALLIRQIREDLTAAAERLARLAGPVKADAAQSFPKAPARRAAKAPP